MQTWAWAQTGQDGRGRRQRAARAQQQRQQQRQRQQHQRNQQLGTLAEPTHHRHCPRGRDEQLAGERRHRVAADPDARARALLLLTADLDLELASPLRELLRQHRALAEHAAPTSPPTAAREYGIVPCTHIAA
uniref:Uncharacterized protein n=1 Tax=Emiliania huxleyi TaxID=2903 RepID=A0A7S3S6T8_EMIHU